MLLSLLKTALRASMRSNIRRYLEQVHPPSITSHPYVETLIRMAETSAWDEYRYLSPGEKRVAELNIAQQVSECFLEYLGDQQA